MNTLLYVSILLLIAHLTPPAGVVQVAEPGFETSVECHAWIKENKAEIIQNVLVSFGPWAQIKGVACMTVKDAKDLNEKWGHVPPFEKFEEKDPNDFLKDFGDGKTL